jgi:predicted secreted protein
MTITSALVLYAVLWFLTLLIVIPIRLKTQGDVGEIVEGTHAGAPAQHNLKVKALITTGIAAVIWVILFWIITQGIITVRDFDWMNRLPPVGEG